MIVPDAPESREQLNRDIENKVGPVIALLLCEKSIADRLELWRKNTTRFKMFDVLLGVMENRPAFDTV